MALVMCRIGCTTADPPWSAEEVATQGGATLAASTQTPVGSKTPHAVAWCGAALIPQPPGSEVDLVV